MSLLKRLQPENVPNLRRNPVDAQTLIAASEIVEDVRQGGDARLRHYAEKFGDLEPGAPIIIRKAQLKDAFMELKPEQQRLLERTAERIRTFATAQRQAIIPINVPIPGGSAGHIVAPVEVAGCYAPGGRFPLPSSVLMTAVTARAAGCKTVWVASPKPTAMTLGAAAIANADALIVAGGAQAIAAMAYGTESIPASDAVVGPGNRWVTAAKQLVSGQVRIDMLAGPSELVILADEHANPETVAADLLAQAEHDPDALPILVTTSTHLADAVDLELIKQLETLDTRETAEAACKNGFIVIAPDMKTGIDLCNRLAPEHLEVLTQDPVKVSDKLKNYGGLFIGNNAAEVLGDYGAGPNHTLPTGGTARSFAGLSVTNFLCLRTWMHIDDPEAAQPLVDDAMALARVEGLHAHERSAGQRKQS